ncbi:unnamed protein product [Prunus armeniaca]|uniref:Uncharacterized protein n=1 Tax=Prunus armeniaca TaxID=36596 RepID=A0A6J5Y373_PRUAR|nr:unnamed protein product [Prunus armeniaca]CAB4318857.1 unnamed protein product [Prunus armeniaca]
MSKRRRNARTNRVGPTRAPHEEREKEDLLPPEALLGLSQKAKLVSGELSPQHSSSKADDDDLSLSPTTM